MQIKFDGALTHEDEKKHIEHLFEMPADATCLHITFEHSPHRAEGATYPNQVSLSLFDPNGCRGARHNNKDQSITLSIAEASPGYIPGELTAGEWTVVVDTHRILPPDTLIYTITVTITNDTITEPPLTYPKGKTASRGKGWYKGDLHGHTLHSDGSWDVPDFVQYARDYNLDFVTLTDHNTVSALAQVDSLSADDVLTMGGMELTTYYGHALALGKRQWQEWRTHKQSMRELAQAVIDSGALYVIAHPRSLGDPDCTGCRWEFEDMMPGIATVVEVWNDRWDEHNQDSLELYYQWLNEGHKLMMTAGTDIHGKLPAGANVGFNIVLADDLTEADILNAVRQGRSYLSSGPDIKTITFSDGKQAMMGDTLTTDAPVKLMVVWDGVEDGDSVHLLAEGQIIQQEDATQSNRITITFDEPAKWYVAEIRADNGDLRAITNPIWVE